MKGDRWPSVSTRMPPLATGARALVEVSAIRSNLTCTIAATFVSKVLPSWMSQTVSAGTVVIKSRPDEREKYHERVSCASHSRTP